MSFRAFPLAGTTPPTLLGRPRTPLFDLTIDVVTPMFGGGAIPGQSDDLWPIRGSTIRGHLRFWWRACNAHKHATAADLFAAEAEIWGQSHIEKSRIKAPSSIDVHATVVPSHEGTPISAEISGPLGYALFPFRGQDGGQPVEGREGVKFQLAVYAASHVPESRHEDLAREVEAALWAWITFGGVGARTRRGCGSLWCNNDARLQPTEAGNIGCWLEENAAIHVNGQAETIVHRVPRLKGALCTLTSASSNPTTAWTNAIGIMQRFRLQKDALGRSTWPDAKSVAELSKSMPTLTGARIPFFPRAEFGLPIGFYFPNLGKDAAFVLQPSEAANTSRMGSPFILKPLMIARFHAVSLVLLLEAPLLADLHSEIPIEITGKNLRKSVPVKNPDWIFDRDKARYVDPLKENNADDARMALIHYAEKQPGWIKPAVQL